MDLEELQNKILSLEQEKQTLATEKENLMKEQENWKLEKMKLLEHNQKLFLKVTGEVKQEAPEKKASAIDLAKTLFLKGGNK